MKENPRHSAERQLFFLSLILVLSLCLCIFSYINLTIQT